MSGFELIHADSDVQRKLRGLDPLAYKLAKDRNNSVKLAEFVDKFDRAFTEDELLQGTEPFHTAVSPTGALIQLRRRRQQAEVLLPHQRIIAVTSALYQDTIRIWPEVTTVYEESSGKITATQYHLGYVPTELLVDTSLSTQEKAILVAEHHDQEEQARNALPAVYYQNNSYTVRWGDGYTESLSDARGMLTKISQVIERGLGAPALSLVADQPAGLSETG